MIRRHISIIIRSNQEYRRQTYKKRLQRRTSTTRLGRQWILSFEHRMDEHDLHHQTLMMVGHIKSQPLKRDKLLTSKAWDSCE